MGKSFNTPGTATGLKAFLQRQAETSYDETASGIKQDISTKAGDTLMSSIQAGGKTQMDILEKLNKVGEDRFKAEQGVGLDLETGTRDTGWMVDKDGALTKAGRAYYATLLYDFRDFGDASDADIELFKKAVVGDVDIANKEYNEAFYKANEQFVSDPDKASPEFTVGDDEETRYSAVTGERLTEQEIVLKDFGIDISDKDYNTTPVATAGVIQEATKYKERMVRTDKPITIGGLEYVTVPRIGTTQKWKETVEPLNEYRNIEIGSVVYRNGKVYLKMTESASGWVEIKPKK